MDFFSGAAPKRRTSGQAVVTTSRVVQSGAKPKSHLSSKQNYNALPDSTRRRIESSRTSSVAAPEASSWDSSQTKARTTPPMKRAKKTRQDASSSPIADERKDLTLRNLLDQRPGKPFHYHKPRRILPVDNATDDTAISSKEICQRSSAEFLPFFEGLTEDAVAILEYPAIGATEEFSLLVSKDPDEYDPISDLLRTVSAIVSHYVPFSKQTEFGDLDALDLSSNAGSILADWQSARSRLQNTDKSSRSGTPLILAADSTADSQVSVADSTYQTDSILRSFTKARNRRNGPLFLHALDRFNNLLHAMKEEGIIERHLEWLGNHHGVPEAVWRTIQDQVYARAAAPDVDKLKKYEAFSDNVYGEMLPPFLSEISRLAQLGPDSIFVDLGSGIGNLIVQAAMQTGCAAYGCEYMPIPANLANAQLREARARLGLWHLQGGQMETWCADFTDSERVRASIRNADLVVANNYAFQPQTNDTLSLLFLDLKDGAMIVSLRSFVPHDFRLTERTLSSPAAILRVEQRSYSPGCVSWTGGSGKYYVHVVDRSKVHAYTTALEQNARKS
ncbi:[histone H3]-lysine(4) N-trimethyltransferase [Malassezia yamatoensis]|uniref:Histone-lysine N-methyltransferase, H3 lysine-79 specific n=1 Tax=Malassezia yamatoensis TaxID=253288 RepID=A0AAJ5YRP3_9BASI|nr:[histone H3]-lysine(4) N-trimethyltransferase [Malassezia yamatoensis]